MDLSPALLPGAPPASHPLHAAERSWPQTNCYLDLWIELLHGMALDPVPALGCLVLQDFDGDQFSFMKVPTADLELLYGIAVQELAIYEDLERHVAVQVGRGRPVLIEVDGFFLPDLATSSYRREHTKTTIAITALDAGAGRCAYLHNAGRYALDGEDYRAILRPARADGLPLFPFAEVVKQDAGGAEPSQAEAALRLLRARCRRRPALGPVAAFRAAFPAQLDRLLEAPERFHAYAFNTFRQLGACAELFGDFLGWLGPRAGLDLDGARSRASAVSDTAKALQFRVARLVARGRRDNCDELFDGLGAAQAGMMTELEARLA